MQIKTYMTVNGKMIGWTWYDEVRRECGFFEEITGVRKFYNGNDEVKSDLNLKREADEDTDTEDAPPSKAFSASSSTLSFGLGNSKNSIWYQQISDVLNLRYSTWEQQFNYALTLTSIPSKRTTHRI